MKRSGSNANQKRILVIADQPEVQSAVGDTLKGEFDVLVDSDPTTAIRTLQTDKEIAVVISDQRLPNGTSFEFLEEAQGLSNATRLMITDYSDLEAVIEGVNRGHIYGYVSRPWTPEFLRLLVYRAVDRFDLRQEVLHARDLLHNLMDNAHDAIFFKDSDLRYIRMNQVTAGLLGFDDAQDAQGKRLSELSDANTVAYTEALERRILQTGEPVIDQTVRQRDKHGIERWLAITRVPIRNEDGENYRLLGIGRDVTARLQAEEALKSSEAALRHAQALARVGHRTWWPAQDSFRDWSQSLTDLLGVGRSELPENLEAWLQFIHPADRKTANDAYRRARAVAGVSRLAYRLAHRGGKVRFVEEVLEPVPQPDEDLAGRRFFSTLQDLTRRTLRERELQLLLSVTRASADITDRTEVLRATLASICHALGWEYGEVWYRDPDDPDYLVTHPAWHASRVEGEEFHEASKWFRFTKGDGLVGRAWASNDLVWEPDIDALPVGEFRRTDLAKKLGITGIIMVPIRTTADRFAAILAFALFDGEKPDQTLAEFLRGVASQLGARFERLEATQRLHEREAQLRSIADHLPGTIFKWVVYPNGDDQITYISEKGAEIFGFDDLSGLTAADFWPRIHEDDVGRVQAAAAEAVANEGPLDFVYRVRDRNEKIRWVENRAHPIRQSDGSLEFDGIILDVSERAQAQEQARFLTDYDTRTGLPNRDLLVTRVDEITRNRARSSRTALLHIAIDQMKAVVTSLGHAQGDRILKLIADRLQRHVLGEGLLARINGNDFALVVPRVKHSVRLNTLILDLRESLKLPFELDGQHIHVTASIGVAHAPDHGSTAEELLHRASIACDRALADGGDTWRNFEHSMVGSGEQRISMHARLRQAIEASGFEMYYQPIVNVDDGRIVGAESLLRWPQDDGTLMNPAEFIPFAEESGLILPLGKWVIGEVVRQAAAMHRQGLVAGPLHINISPRQISRGDVESLLRESLAATGCEASWIELELTESGIMENSETAFRQLAAFRELGCGLAIDDFGTGHSSLSYLRNLPVDTLKVDRSFVVNMIGDRTAAALVNGIIDLAHRLGMKVIAEGVESEQELVFLKAYRCDRVQGYYFYKPMPYPELLEVLRKNEAG